MSRQHLIQLMSRYQAGEESAFEELYQALKPPLLSYLTTLSWSRQRAEDLLQETFLLLHRSRATYLPGRPVAPWAFSIARHAYLMDRRKQLRYQTREVASDDPPELPIPPDVERLGDFQGLQKALVQLPKKQLEAVLLHHLWGFSFREIGATLGIRTVTAKLRAHRGLRKLRDIMNSAVTGTTRDAKLKERTKSYSTGNKE